MYEIKSVFCALPDRRLVASDDPLEVLHGELLHAFDRGVVAQRAGEPPPAHHHREDRVAVANDVKGKKLDQQVAWCGINCYGVVSTVML